MFQRGDAKRSQWSGNCYVRWYAFFCPDGDGFPKQFLAAMGTLGGSYESGHGLGSAEPDAATAGLLRSATATSGQYAHHRARGLDRKSTRLNSSHRTISYAVFCLKKKKNRRLIFNISYLQCTSYYIT